MTDDSQLTVKSGSPKWTSVVNRCNDRPNECTIFRSDMAEGVKYSSWITAVEGS